MLSRPVIIGAELDFWEMSPMALRTALGSFVTSWPATTARPVSGLARVERIFTVVDDRGGLTGTVRSEQPEDLALADSQGESVEGLDGRLAATRRIRLDEVGGLDGETR
jgi:hypothetical protein